MKNCQILKEKPLQEEVLALRDYFCKRKLSVGETKIVMQLYAEALNTFITSEFETMQGLKTLLGKKDYIG